MASACQLVVAPEHRTTLLPTPQLLMSFPPVATVHQVQVLSPCSVCMLLAPAILVCMDFNPGKDFPKHLPGPASTSIPCGLGHSAGS